MSAEGAHVQPPKHDKPRKRCTAWLNASCTCGLTGSTSLLPNAIKLDCDGDNCQMWSVLSAFWTGIHDGAIRGAAAYDTKINCEGDNSQMCLMLFSLLDRHDEANRGAAAYNVRAVAA